jgi:SOS-response transcriptional repressor LexA
MERVGNLKPRKLGNTISRKTEESYTAPVNHETVNILNQASQNYISSSSEFLGETRNILSKILSIRKSELTKSEINDLRRVIQSIDTAFRKANGLP